MLSLFSEATTSNVIKVTVFTFPIIISPKKFAKKALICPSDNTAKLQPKTREWIFQGQNTLQDFCTWLFEKGNKGVTAIRHNFSNYDGQFILKISDR